MVEEFNYEIAIIFRKEEKDGKVYFKPIKAIEGNFDEDECMYFDKDGYAYFHITDFILGNCYGYREEIAVLCQKYPNLGLKEIKKEYLKEARKYDYIVINNDNDYSTLLKEDKITKKRERFIDFDIEEVESVLNDKKNQKEDAKKDLIDKIAEQAKNLKSGESTTITVALPIKKEKQEEKRIDIDTKYLYAELKKKIIGQDEPIRKILTSIWMNYNSSKEDKAKNIFINGQTATGKTEIFRTISKLINVPCVIEDINEFTATGYVGRSVDEMLIDILRETDGDLEAAQNSILIIDEIDKIANVNPLENVGTTAVQHSLLKLIEDGVYPIKYKGKTNDFCTKKILVAALGAFSTINEQPATIGFEKENIKKMYADVTSEDIIRYGIIPELMGRFPTLVSLNELGEEELFQIAKYSELSILVNQRKFLDSRGISLLCSDEVITLIAKEAKKLKVGARGLETTLTTMLSEAMFDISFNNEQKYNELELLPETVYDNKKYILRKK